MRAGDLGSAVGRGKSKGKERDSLNVPINSELCRAFFRRLFFPVSCGGGDGLLFAYAIEQLNGSEHFDETKSRHEFSAGRSCCIAKR